MTVSVFVVLMVVTEYFGFTHGGLYGVVAAVVVVSFVGFCVYEIDYLLRRTLRRFAREWRESHPLVSE